MRPPQTAESDQKAALRSIWRDLAEKRIEDGVDWPRIARALFADLDRSEAMHAEAFRIGVTHQERLRGQEERVRQTFAQIGYLKAAQRELMDLGVSHDDAGRVLAGVKRAWVDLVVAALRFPPVQRSATTPGGDTDV